MKGPGPAFDRETTSWHLPGTSPRLAFQQPVPSLCACPRSHPPGVGVSGLGAQASGLRRSRFLFSSFSTLSVSSPVLEDLGLRRGHKGISCPERGFQGLAFLLVSDAHQTDAWGGKAP